MTLSATRTRTTRSALHHAEQIGNSVHDCAITTNSIPQFLGNSNTRQQCGYCEPAAVRNGECYERKTGRKWEKHHAFGKAMPYTVHVRANHHRLLTARQRDWPASARNPQSALDWLALLAYGMSELLWYLSQLLKRVGAYLVAVDGQMKIAYGERWHDALAPLDRISAT